MKAVIIVFAILLFAYIGYALGLDAYCNQIPVLRKASKYAWVIPLYLVIYPIYVLFSKNVENRREHFKKFMSIPDKGILFATVFEEIEVEEQGKNYNRQFSNIERSNFIRPKRFFDVAYSFY